MSPLFCITKEVFRPFLYLQNSSMFSCNVCFMFGLQVLKYYNVCFIFTFLIFTKQFDVSLFLSTKITTKQALIYLNHNKTSFGINMHNIRNILQISATFLSVFPGFKSQNTAYQCISTEYTSNQGQILLFKKLF